MKTVFGLVLFVAAIAGLLIGPDAYAAPAPLDDAFIITSYDVRISISERNVYDITEVIDVHFNEPRHGIFRNIPTEGVLERKSGGAGYYRADITDIDVEGGHFNVSREGNDVIVRIGDANAFVEGDQTYRISYRMNFGSDIESGFDEAYHNIIGSGWDTMIQAVTFTVTLPKAFDASGLGFSMGSNGSTGYDPEALEHTVEGNTVTGKTKKPLAAHEALTMRLELPQGYFTGSGGISVEKDEKALPPDVIDATGSSRTVTATILLIAFVIFAVGGLAAAVVLAVVFGRDKGRGHGGENRDGITQNDLYDPANPEVHKKIHMAPLIWTSAGNDSGGTSGGTGSGGGDGGSGGGGGGSW